MQKKQKSSVHIKKGDTVKILTGKDRGKIGEITKIIKNSNQVVVQDINVKKKHVKPRKEGEIGKILQFEAPIHSSNVMVYNPENQLASRVSYQKDESGKKVRVLKKLLNTK
uniref:Ribosomal protein L24 n=1 Tax=Storeatula sp. CCMP1868 TaxID=195070 RepID=A0A222AHY8_9CRYP|nr:ribosomal protein L24 [Storeatula sp. CCMP1868]